MALLAQRVQLDLPVPKALWVLQALLEPLAHKVLQAQPAQPAQRALWVLLDLKACKASRVYREKLGQQDHKAFKVM